MGKIKVFLDSDVILAALLSQTGASFEVLKNPRLSKYISGSIKLEVETVAKRLSLVNFNATLFSDMKVVKINLDKERVVEKYLPFVLDAADSHVSAAAHKAKASFLLTHNTKHYRADKIKDNLQIITLKPGLFLQHLRIR